MALAKTFRDLLERYRRGERDFAGPELDTDLSNDLSDLRLDGMDLFHSFIVANFRSASSVGAHFHQANLKTCDFSNADLTAADFSGALCATTFAGAPMNATDFTGAFCNSLILQAGENPDW